MKANFVLTKENQGVFIQRLKKMLSITGMLETQKFYTKGKEKETFINKNNINYYLGQLSKTQKGYLDNDKISIKEYKPSKFGNKKYPGGILIRYYSDASKVIYFGQKIKFTPNQIILIGGLLENDMKTGGKTVFKPFYNVALGKKIIKADEEYANAYYKSMMEEYSSAEKVFGKKYL